MKILTFTSLYPNQENPDFGIFVKNRMVAFAQLPDVQLKVVAPVPYFPAFKIFKKWSAFAKVPVYEVIDSIEVFHPRYLVTPKFGMTLYGVWMFVGSFSCVKKLHNDFTFDLIDAHFIYPDGLAAVFFGKFFNKPVVISARGSDVNLYPQIPLVRNLLRWVLNKADYLISVSGSLGDLMVAEGAPSEKIAVIPNGIDAKRFYQTESLLARLKLNLPADKKYLLTVGGLIERKGIHLLIDALQLLKKKGALDFQSYILGKGELFTLLQNKISEYQLQDCVFLLGHVPNENLIDWYNAADLFFLGSSREGWPNVVCESLACGTPVVATPVNGIPEILDSEELGLMVERTPEAFACGIEQAFARSWDRERIAERGQERTWENVAREVHELFGTVLHNAQN